MENMQALHILSKQQSWLLLSFETVQFALLKLAHTVAADDNSYAQFMFAENVTLDAFISRTVMRKHQGCGVLIFSWHSDSRV